MKLEQSKLDSNYDIIVQKKNGKFYVSIRELVLSTSNENLQTAYLEIENKKETAIFNMKEAGLKKSIPAPVKDQIKEVGNKSLKNNLILFTCKIVILLLLILVITDLIRRSSSHIKQLIVSQIINITQWPDNKIEKYSIIARKLSIKISPIFREFKMLKDESGKSSQ